MQNYLFTNTKLKKVGAKAFDLQPGKTCVKCKICCFGQKGFYKVFPKACLKKWFRNFKLAKNTKLFITTLSSEIKRLKTTEIIRIHAVGDFYDQDYLNAWAEIIKQNPTMHFYAYSKSLHLDWSEILSLPNFQRIQSLGGEFDSLINWSEPVARVFKTLEELEEAEYNNGSADDRLAAWGALRVGLIQH